MRSSKLGERLFIVQVLLLALVMAVPGWAAERCVYKFDNVITVFDRSGSMLEDQAGTKMTKFVYAGDIAEGIASGIPKADEGELYMGLKVFGFHLEDEPLKIRTALARQKLDRDALVKAIKGFRPPRDVFGFLTPLAGSLADLRAEANQWPGRTAVFLISDGQDTTFIADPVKEARQLKEAKKDVAIFTVMMTGCKQGRKAMEEIASVGGGKFFEAAELADKAKREAALREIFLDCKLVAEKPPAPPVVKPVPMPVRPAVAVTDEMFPVILFDFDHISIRASERPRLEGAAKILKDNPDVRVRLEGHTDNIGTEEYNQALSERRARSVLEYLNKLFGIAKERIQAIGFGESKPVAPNDTKEGRQKNRRVEFKVQK